MPRNALRKRAPAVLPVPTPPPIARQFAPPLDPERVPGRSVAVISHEGYELLHYELDADVLKITLIADKSAFEENLNGAPVNACLNLYDGRRIEGRDLRVENPKLLTSKILTVSLIADSPDCFKHLAPRKTEFSFI